MGYFHKHLKIRSITLVALRNREYIMESTPMRFLFTSCKVSIKRISEERAIVFYDAKRVNKNCTKHFFY